MKHLQYTLKRTHNLRVIQDKLAGSDCGWDALTGVLHPSHWLHCILALGPSRTLVLHSTPATQQVVVTDAALTINEANTLLKGDVENLYIVVCNYTGSGEKMQYQNWTLTDDSVATYMYSSPLFHCSCLTGDDIILV